MKDHFNKASQWNYKTYHRKRVEDMMWEHTINSRYSKHARDTWSSTTIYRKGAYAPDRHHAELHAHILDAIGKLTVRKSREDLRAERAARLAADAVNKACAEALAESAASRPSLFSRLLGRKP